MSVQPNRGGWGRDKRKPPRWGASAKEASACSWTGLSRGGPHAKPRVRCVRRRARPSRPSRPAVLALPGDAAMNAPAAVDLDREELLKDIAIVAWLRDEPYYRAALLCLVNAERPRRGVTFRGETEDDEVRLAEKRRLIERYFATALWGPCASCYWPVVTFVDGARLDWESVAIHRCARPSAPAQRPPWAREVRP